MFHGLSLKLVVGDWNIWVSVCSVLRGSTETAKSYLTEMGEKKSDLVIILEWLIGILIPGYTLQVALEGKEPCPDVSHLLPKRLQERGDCRYWDPDSGVSRLLGWSGWGLRFTHSPPETVVESLDAIPPALNKSRDRVQRETMTRRPCLLSSLSSIS